ncbi:MAG: hypothetical protein ACJATN_001212 [Neolewinella sp.]
MTAGEAKNVDNAVVLARLFNEASGQKAPSKKHGLFISRPLSSAFKKKHNHAFKNSLAGTMLPEHPRPTGPKRSAGH